MVSRSAAARSVRWFLAATLSTKNAEAEEGKHWDLSVNDYVDDPTCDAGYHWDNNTYSCIPD